MPCPVAKAEYHHQAPIKPPDRIAEVQAPPVYNSTELNNAHLHCPMIVLGIESSCDETGVALVEASGGGVPRLRRARAAQPGRHAPGLRRRGAGAGQRATTSGACCRWRETVLAEAARSRRTTSTSSPTRAARAWPARCWSAPASPARSALRSASRCSACITSKATCCRRSCRPIRRQFPFVALLVSGGHTQLMRVDGVGRYELLGETDRRRGRRGVRQVAPSCWAWAIPAARRWRALAEQGDPKAFKLPRPLLHSGDLDFSFAGLKTAVLTQVQKLGPDAASSARPTSRPATQAAIVDVLVRKSLRALRAQRAEPPRGRRRRRREPAPARASSTPRAAPARRARALPGARAVHRQRRDDRAGRRDAAAARPAQARIDYAFDVRPRWPLARPSRFAPRRMQGTQLTEIRVDAGWRLTSVSVSTPLSGLACDEAWSISDCSVKLRAKLAAARSRRITGGWPSGHRRPRRWQALRRRGPRRRCRRAAVDEALTSSRETRRHVAGDDVAALGFADVDGGAANRRASRRAAPRTAGRTRCRTGCQWRARTAARRETGTMNMWYSSGWEVVDVVFAAVSARVQRRMLLNSTSECLRRA